jgi:hypothetical protein
MGRGKEGGSLMWFNSSLKNMHWIGIISERRSNLFNFNHIKAFFKLRGNCTQAAQGYKAINLVMVTINDKLFFKVNIFF